MSHNPKPPATLKIRDQYFVPETDSTGKFVFPEEFVEGNKTDRVKPNVPPELHGKPRTIANTLGTRFTHHPKPQIGEPDYLKKLGAYHFDRFAQLLMDRIRDYNRALYRFRRAYVNHDHKLDVGRMMELPNENRTFIFGLGDPDDTVFVRIEAEFAAAAGRLKKLLDDASNGTVEIEDYVHGLKNPLHPDDIKSQPLFVKGFVDCIRVNDYILSVRIGAVASDESIPVKLGIKDMSEPPFSSSSFTSISSAFSSYSSLDMWHAAP
jgi:hypothetical protein